MKGLLPNQVAEIGASIILANTYHLALRPGSEIVAELGGLHRFMGWSGPILTDSGGFQVFSLETLRKVDDNGVEFKSHLDGAVLNLTPERATQIQEELGADIAMCFDECPPAGGPVEQVEQAVDRTTRWARALPRCSYEGGSGALLNRAGGWMPGFAKSPRVTSSELEFPGYAIGGLSVGEAIVDMYATLDFTVPMLPADKPRYLMGVGRPEDLIEGGTRGIDMFDCVMPTRNGRNASAFTSRGRVKLRNAQHQRDESPLDPACACYTCQNFSRAYLRHLFMVEEMAGPILVSLHNIAFYIHLHDRDS
ncbi:MAG: tRNA guanosine(34) transglycosylase Tgt [Thermomicrobiales bacterium]